MRMSEALGYPCRDPVRLLALAVIARWKEDHERGMRDDLGEEWAELAEVPSAWILEAHAAGATLGAR